MRVVDLELSLRPSSAGYVADARLSNPGSQADSLLAADTPVALDPPVLLPLTLDSAYGFALTTQLFSDQQLRDAWKRARALADGANAPLRLRLRLPAAANDLHALRWETLRDPLSDAPLATDARLRLVRFLDSPDTRPITVGPKPDLRALIVAANPRDLSDYGLAEIDVESEVGRVRKALGAIPLTVVGDHEDAESRRATLSAIQAALRAGPAILCLICHGTQTDDDTMLWLEDDGGKTCRVSGSDFGQIIAQLDRPPLLVTLIACDSGGTIAALGPRLAQGGVGAVLAMQAKLSLAAAQALLPALFTALASDGAIDRAVSVGRAALRDLGEWWVPALWLRVREGRLFAPPVPANGIAEAHIAIQHIKEVLRAAGDAVEGAPDDVLAQPKPALAAPTFERLKQDWGNAPEVRAFYGRSKEIAELKRWIVDDHCHLVAVLGMGGMGKTSLVIRCIQQLIGECSDEFEYIIWRSLRSAPPFHDLLSDLIEFFSDRQKGSLSRNASTGVSPLIPYLKSHRCLLVLDNFDAIFADDRSSSLYLEGYDGYGDLVRQISEVSHKSCLILTSRERLEILPDNHAVCSLELQGLSQTAGREILTSVPSLSASNNEWEEIIGHYAGNPLALNIVAAGVRDFLSSNVTEFLDRLHQGQFLFKDMDDLLVRHFERISDKEREVMYWLAISQETVSYQDLQAKCLSPKSDQGFSFALEDLRRRFLVEYTQTMKYTQQPIVMEYVTKRFIEEICREIKTGTISLLNNHVLIEATTRDYVRETQTRLILKPLIDILLHAFGSQEALENQLLEIISNLRKTPLANGYAAGNILNFLVLLDGVLERNLRLRDFSRLTIRQAYLQGVDLHDVDFSESNFISSIFSEPLGSIFSVAFSPNGHLIAAGDANGEINIWQVENYQKIATCSENNSLIWALAFSPDGKILASGSDDSLVRLWDVETSQCMQELKGHKGAVRAVAFSSDGKTLASGSTDYTIRLWNPKDGRCADVLDGHANAVWAIAFHPGDASILASGGVDKTVRLWRRSPDHQWQQRALYEHEKSVCSVAFSPNGRFLASSSHDKVVRLWNLVRDALEKDLGKEQAHEDWVWAVSFSPDSKILVSCSEDQNIKLWDIETGECLDSAREHTHAVRSIAFSPSNGKMIISGSYDQTVKLLEWDIERRRAQCLRTWRGLASQIRSIAFSPDSTTLASCGGDRSIRLWNINFETGEYWERSKLEGHTDWVWSVTFSPDGKILASSSDDGTIMLWNLEGEAARLAESLHQSSRVRCLAFSPNGEFLVCGCNDYKIRVWRRNNKNIWKLHKILPGHNNWIWSVVFHPDGAVFASASEDKTIRLWDINTWSTVKLFQGHTNMIYSTAFSADGKVLASGSGDHTVKLWDVEEGDCLQTLTGHIGWVWSVAFNADSRMLISSSGDHTVKLWDISDISAAYCRMTLGGVDAHSGWVRSAKFSSDGKFVASGGDDETMRLWDVQTGKCLAVLRAKGPYAGVNIRGVKGLTQTEKNSLKALGAFE